MVLDDTHPRAAAALLELLRQAAPAQRFAAAAELTEFVCAQAMAAIAATMPGAGRQEIGLRWCEVHYGAELAARLRRHLAGDRA